jgi:hypothetical protein
LALIFDLYELKSAPNVRVQCVCPHTHLRVCRLCQYTRHDRAPAHATPLSNTTQPVELNLQLELAEGELFAAETSTAAVCLHYLQRGEALSSAPRQPPLLPLRPPRSRRVTTDASAVRREREKDAREMACKERAGKSDLAGADTVSEMPKHNRGSVHW